MGVKLAEVKRESAEVALTVVEQVTVTRGKQSHVLAVCERAGTLLLTRERERGTLGEDGKRSRENGTERYHKPTADVADIADAVALGLLAVE